MYSPLATTHQNTRPEANKRQFSSPAIEATIESVESQIGDPGVKTLFRNCFPNSLDTTVSYAEKDGQPDSFVITGDIDAMWLRDSSAQIWPYLRFAKEDTAILRLCEGLVRRHTQQVLLDPYANAFLYDGKISKWAGDHTQMLPGVYERKWEIDSLCYVVRFAFGLWCLDASLSCFGPDLHKALGLIVKTFKDQQRRGSHSESLGDYSFQRTTLISTDTVPGNGYGNPTRPVGLIHSAFRPSDDACIYPFLIPSNLFAVDSLRKIARLAKVHFEDAELASAAYNLADEVHGAVMTHAVIRHPQFGEIFAYEVDGYGNSLMMDDANIPSLLALPYLGLIDRSDSIYQNTRRFVLSDSNPYFYRGKGAEGVGGPHIGAPYIWPMAIIMRALTSVDESEVLHCLKMLNATHANTGFMHESFHAEDPFDFTRSWFGWVNGLFGELVLDVMVKMPGVLKAHLG